MDLNYLRTFLAVADASNFTKAATGMGLSQPTVTARIKRLELSLGADLFQRGAGGARLTEAGARLRHYARSIVALTESAEHAVAEPAGQTQQLRVLADPSLLAHRLVTLVEYMHFRHPETQLDLSPLADDPLTALREGQADCVYFVGAQTISRDIEFTLLSPESMVLVGDRGHPLARQRAVTTDQLLHTPLVCAQRTFSYQQLLEQLLQESGRNPAEGALVLGTVAAAKCGVREGLGLAFVPRVEVAGELASGELAAIDWQPPFQIFSQAAWRPELAAAEAFQELLGVSARAVSEQLADATVRRAA